MLPTLLLTIAVGLLQSEQGQVNSKEQAKQKLSKWLK
jgi:hypothetical protein